MLASRGKYYHKSSGVCSYAFCTMLHCKNNSFRTLQGRVYAGQFNTRPGAFPVIFFQEEPEMNDNNTQNRQHAIGPVGAVATVPGEFISSAIFEAVQGVCR